MGGPLSFREQEDFRHYFVARLAAIWFGCRRRGGCAWCFCATTTILSCRFGDVYTASRLILQVAEAPLLVTCQVRVKFVYRVTALDCGTVLLDFSKECRFQESCTKPRTVCEASRTCQSFESALVDARPRVFTLDMTFCPACKDNSILATPRKGLAQHEVQLTRHSLVSAIASMNRRGGVSRSAQPLHIGSRRAGRYRSALQGFDLAISMLVSDYLCCDFNAVVGHI